MTVNVTTYSNLLQHFVLSNLKEKFPEVYKDKNIDDIPSVKEVWKWSFGPLFEKELHLHFMINSPFVINISVAYDDDQAECGWMWVMETMI